MTNTPVGEYKPELDGNQMFASLPAIAGTSMTNMPPKDRWKYIVRTVNITQVEKCLNVEGNNGWEAFAVTTTDLLATICFKQLNLDWP